jgi:hypothetical protein
MVKIRHWRDRKHKNLSFGEQRKEAQKVGFLKFLKVTGRVNKACDELGLSRWIVYRWKDEDPEFAQAWIEAKSKAKRNRIEQLEEAAVERAMNDSDTLLRFLLQSYKPAVYRERSEVEHKGKVLIWDATKPMKESPLSS